MTTDEIKKLYHADAAEMRTVRHMDIIKNDGRTLGKVQRSKEGFLVGTVPVARVGVMNYLLADGTVLREFVPPETLFDNQSMGSLKLKPVTNSHPPERKVTVDNAAYRQVGTTGETVARNGDFLDCSVAITDKSCIMAVDGGKQELSPGYECDLAFSKGKFGEQEYDAVQVARRYNHLAVVDSARGGAEIRMKMDNLDGAEIDFLEVKPIKKENTMKFLIDGIEYDAAPEVVKYIEKLDTKNKEQKTALDSANTEKETLKGANAALTTKVDGLEKRDIAKEVNDAVSARLALVTRVTPVLGTVDAKLDDRGIKVAVLAKKCPELKIDEKTTITYIDAAFDVALATVKADDNVTRQQKEMNNNDGQGKRVEQMDEKAAREKMIERQKNAYKNETK